MDTYVLKLRGIRDVLPTSQQYSALCCAYNDFRACVMDKITYSCNERLGLQTSDFIDHRLVKMQKGFADVDRCDTLCAQAPTNVTAFLDDISIDNGYLPQKESPLLIFMDIAATQSNERRY